MTHRSNAFFDSRRYAEWRRGTLRRMTTFVFSAVTSNDVIDRSVYWK